MRRSGLSLLTAALAFVAAAVFLLARQVGHAVLWAAIALIWLVVAGSQHMQHDDVQVYAHRRLLLRRFWRLLLFWS